MAARTLEAHLDSEPPAPDLSRRSMIRCAALCGVAVPLLVACGSGDDGTDAGAGDSPSASSSSPSESPSASEPSEPSEGEQAGGGAVDGLVASADVPVGGGVILAEEELVVTQPAKGRFRGYSNRCTHQGSALSSVENGVITCPNHGSQFAIEDGANVAGPNGEPAGSVPALPAVKVRVQGGQVVRA
jgi:nitrite reductase/ring-hydroxylating ferredoxin subunit